MFFISFAQLAEAQPQPVRSSVIVQDAVDDILDKKDGLIKRDKDPKLYVAIVVSSVHTPTLRSIFPDRRRFTPGF